MPGAGAEGDREGHGEGGRAGGGRTGKLPGPGGASLPIQPGRVNWHSIDRGIGETYHLSPVQIDSLTLAEIAVLLDQKGKAGHAPDMGDDEIHASIQAWLAMTPRQRLEQARR